MLSTFCQKSALY